MQGRAILCLASANSGGGTDKMGGYCIVLAFAQQKVSLDTIMNGNGQVHRQVVMVQEWACPSSLLRHTPQLRQPAVASWTSLARAAAEGRGLVLAACPAVPPAGPA